MEKIKRIALFLLLFLLLYTRLFGLNWGFPYPFHPDERNMAVAIEQLSCDLVNVKDCFNPRFFAYGQFPLYLGYAIVYIFKLVAGGLNTPIGFQEATFSLRLISALASILLVYFILRTVQLLLSIRSKRHSRPDRESRLRSRASTGQADSHFRENDNWSIWITLLIVIFSPALIQFAHFGTTESLLMLFYTWITYESLLLMNKKITLRHFLIVSAIVSGLGVATKVSALVFIALPVLGLFYYHKKNFLALFKSLFVYIFLTLLIGVLFSPHNLISFNEFLSSLSYESDVAFGRAEVFYTRQFEGTIPILFQFLKIFPYALGWPILILFLGGFFILPFNKQNNFLRFGFLVYFLPNAFLSAKWTRFMAPVMPIMIAIAVLFLFVILNRLSVILIPTSRRDQDLVKRKLDSSLPLGMTTVKVLVILILIIPGIAYFSVYQRSDVRLIASDWIEQNIPEGSYILSETANVVDIPVDSRNFYQYVSFNFYDLDQSVALQTDLENHLRNANYIFVPSRRLFANHTCLNVIPDSIGNHSTLLMTSQILNPASQRGEQVEDDKCKRYPQLNEYYRKLLNGELGFVKVAEFSSFPKISFLDRTLLEFPDEQAEETWTVFDHPVIRIYHRTKTFGGGGL